MKAVTFSTYGTPDVLEIQELPIPEPGPGEVRMRVHSAAVNPTDAAFRAGAYAPRVDELPDVVPPFIPGMDASGFVDAIGGGVDDRLSVGEEVVAFVRPVSPQGGAYAEYIVLPATSVVRAPKGLDLAASATFLMNAMTASAALDELALMPGDWLVVTGAPGMLGGYLIQLAKRQGLRVIADAAPQDVELVGSFGADEIVPRGDGFVAGVHAIVPEGAPGLADAGILNEKAVPAVADNGVMIAFQGWQGPADRGIRLFQLFIAAWGDDTSRMQSLVADVESGVLDIRLLESLAPEQAGEAHRALHAGGIRGRNVLTFGA